MISKERASQLIFEWQSVLFSPVPVSVLSDACCYLTPSEYDQVVQERKADSLCGYPLCSSSISRETTLGYKISLKAQQVYDRVKLGLYCCLECYAASKYLESQLNSDPLHLRHFEKLSIDLVPPRTSLEEHLKRESQVESVVETMPTLSLDNNNIVERVETMECELIPVTHANAVEGYVPKSLKSIKKKVTFDDDKGDDSWDELSDGSNEHWLQPSRKPAVPTLSLFGSLWILLDRLVTPLTKSWTLATESRPVSNDSDMHLFITELDQMAKDMLETSPHDWNESRFISLASTLNMTDGIIPEEPIVFLIICKSVQLRFDLEWAQATLPNILSAQEWVILADMLQ